jgi:uncharacterized protein YbjT (DUF2867 family)
MADSMASPNSRLSPGEQDSLVGVIGATSLVGTCLLPLLSVQGRRAIAFSRQMFGSLGDGVEWRQLSLSRCHSLQTSDKAANHSTKLFDRQVFDYPQRDEREIAHWICLAPIWVLPEYFDLLEAQGAKRVVVLSSTSRFTKNESVDPEEQVLAHRLADGEVRVQEWAESRGVEWVILRPTLIYGLGMDKNITEIMRFIRRFGFFPLFGRANGLRQPIHVEDVAVASLAALKSTVAVNHAYNISGGETLPYREMVSRMFDVLRRRPRFVMIPMVIFKLAVACLRILPRYKHWSSAMAERMNHDLVFDHSDAARDLGFSPRPFQLTPEEMPR